MKNSKQFLALALLVSANGAFAMYQPAIPSAQLRSEAQPVKTEAELKTDFLNAVRSNQVTTITALLQQSPNLANAEDELGTALQQAALNGNLAIVKALIRAGANGNASQNYGMTPLMFAINGGNKDVIRTIIDLQGVDVNAQDGSGQTALNWVDFSSRLSDADRAEIKEWLKARGAQ